MKIVYSINASNALLSPFTINIYNTITYLSVYSFFLLLLFISVISVNSIDN